MKKNIYHVLSIFMLCAVLVGFLPGDVVFAKEAAYNPKHIVAEIKKEDVHLYYDKKADGMLQGFYLKSGNKTKYFDWSSIDQKAFYPEIKILDSKYIAVICTTGKGTGVNEEKLHIINRSNLKTVAFDNPVDVVKSKVKFDIKAPKVSVKIDNKTWNGSFDDIDISHFNKTVGYESIIIYDVENDGFTVRLSAQITPAAFIGDIEIQYYLNEKKTAFVPKYINFNFYKTEIK
ncbi:hypothetical protein [Anaerocolumna xylanovorans]|uniref:Uncharacterized protein n=1 Tax=Anaerocolumna xylanovorans DSM 12503 TaxID=1121345 RepID=A0A1M7YJ95_9FIRM|nr:hypothetical protein [Anaerocolumna xylanovorans]SHO52661.1 hypothetical protein SAMN02745217_03765 [Anaerocolumna xylanovorans DSM 12503]